MKSKCLKLTKRETSTQITAQIQRKYQLKYKLKLNLQKKKKGKKKEIIYKGDSRYIDVPGSAKAGHSVLCASIYRFSNDGRTLRLKLWIPKNWPKWRLYRDIENYVTTLFCLSSNFLLWLAVLCHNRAQLNSYCDCRDIKSLVATFL